MSTKIRTFRIFGEIEATAAETMIAAGEATKIPAAEIPEAERHNEHGQHALFAVRMSVAKARYFEELIKGLT